LVFASDRAFTLDSNIEAGASAHEEALDHFIGFKSDPELITGKPRLGYNDLGGTDGKLVTDKDSIFQQAVSCKILPEYSHRQRVTWQFGSPIVMVSQWIAVNCLSFAAVYGEISLSVSLQIQPPKSDTTLDWLLVDTGRHSPTVPLHLAWKTAIDGHQPHLL